MAEILTPTDIIYEQAPCRLDGEISSDLQQESKEGTCRCPIMPEGCCVDAIGVIIPKILKRNPPLSPSN